MNQYHVEHPLFPNNKEFVQIVSQTAEQIIMRIEYPDGTIFIFIEKADEVEFRCNKLIHVREEDGVMYLTPDIYTNSSIFEDVI